jgi:hypothetical protein
LQGTGVFFVKKGNDFRPSEKAVHQAHHLEAFCQGSAGLHAACDGKRADEVG